MSAAEGAPDAGIASISKVPRRGSLAARPRGYRILAVEKGRGRLGMHEVAIVGSGPTGLMLAGELRLAGVDAVVLERRPSQELAGSRGGGIHSRTIELLDHAAPLHAGAVPEPYRAAAARVGGGAGRAVPARR